MKAIDMFRYFGIVILLCVVELITDAMGINSHPAPYDRISLWAFMITILWAIRDGQKGKEG